MKEGPWFLFNFFFASSMNGIVYQQLLQIQTGLVVITINSSADQTTAIELRSLRPQLNSSSVHNK